MKKGGKKKIGSRGTMHLPSLGGKDPHAHPTHAKMNQAHGTPAGFGAPEGYQDQNPPAGIMDDSEDHRECMTD